MPVETIVFIVFASLTIPLVIIPAIICVIIHRNNVKRKQTCTQKIYAEIVDIKIKNVRHDVVIPGKPRLRYYTLEYQFGNYDYTAVACDMVGRPKVGSRITIYVDPYLPENYYIEGIIEEREAGIKRACFASMGIFAFFCLVFALPFFLGK